MAEETYKVQLSTTVNGNLVNLRAQSPEELKELVEGLAKNVDETFTAFAQFKDGVILKDLFTGNAQKPLAGQQSNSNTSASNSGSGGGIPSCKHGEMKDLRGNGYKSDFYCTAKNRDEQCKPRKA